MVYSSVFLRKPSRALPPLLAFHRYMGGGPRTFPGGLNKWQWKRLHEKKARDKEKRLLDQEKQLYQARIRSQIRAKLAASGEVQSTFSGQQSQPRPDNHHTHDPLSPQEQIKALADRFMKEGAEDLWNDDDGPVKSLPAKPIQNRMVGEPIDLRKIMIENSNKNVNPFENFNTSSNFSKSRQFSTSLIRSGIDIVCGYNSTFPMNSRNMIKSRCYSVATRGKMRPGRSKFTRNESSESDSDSDSDEGLGELNGRRINYPRLGLSESHLLDEVEDSESDDEEEGNRSRAKMMMSSAALGKYDMKTTKRVPLKFLEDEDDLSRHVEAIRKEVNRRNSMDKDEDEDEDEAFLSSIRFDECDISPLTVKALTASGYVQMTRVQEATLSACLEGNDVLVKAKTGTGKSAAFLLPGIETVLRASNNNRNQRVPPLYVLIICPTRELASQIAAEANVLLKYHDGVGVLSLVGGTRFKVDQKRLESDPSQIIVATPGRLLDHIENKSGFSVRLMGLKMLILDEADHLLDLGFRKDIEKIVDCLPRQRQSLLFSATMPKEVRRVSQLVLKREHAYIDTVGLSGVDTCVKVKQSYVVAPHEEHFPVVHHILENHISQVADYKVIIFCTTAMMTSLMFSLFREMKLNVREIHSRKPQIARTRISDEFKESKRLILITSDVSARGMNYPDVTLVIQVGIPPDRGQYIHRLGRTGREGKDGQGIILLAPWEEYFLDEIKDLPLEKCPLPHIDTNAKKKLQDSMSKIDASVKEAAYHAWLGFYNSISHIGRDKTTLVELANSFSESIGLQKPPSLFRRTAIKMGMKDIPGIRIRK